MLTPTPHAPRKVQRIAVGGRLYIIYPLDLFEATCHHLSLTVEYPVGAGWATTHYGNLRMAAYVGEAA